LKGRSVLNNGGAGFIGSHLAEKLLKLGYEVRVLDNLSSGSLENLSQIMNEMEFVKGDCKNRKDVLDSMKDVEVVFHLAANPEVSWNYAILKHALERTYRLLMWFWRLLGKAMLRLWHLRPRQLCMEMPN